MLKIAKFKEFFDFLPQSFICNIYKQKNKPVINMTFKELMSQKFYEDKENAEKILKTINFNEKWMIAANLKQSWPDHRYVYISEDERLVILINFCDHLQVLRLFNVNDLDIYRSRAFNII